MLTVAFTPPFCQGSQRDKLRPMGHFQKTGLLVRPPTSLPWSLSHAAVPFVDSGDPLRLYFSTRDESGRSQLARAMLDLDAHRAELEPKAVLRPGPLGAFDDRGVMGSCIVRSGGSLFLYYTGWELGVTVPFRNFIGCAVSNDGGVTFRKVSKGPVLGPIDLDPFMAHSPWVLVEDGRWRMWYCSTTKWYLHGNEPRHLYHIKYAESGDGIAWEREGHVCVDFAGPHEYALSRPCVIRDGDRYRMWFSTRGEQYRLGYAESSDGLSWERHDELAGLEPSAEGWDSEMICYACVFDRDGDRHALYNGNGYGRTGIGHAVLEK